MRKVHRNIEEEDATSMGGWLFADSFLALMVIFLATISFVPALGGSILRMKKAGLTQFENTKFDLGTNSALKPDQIVLRLTLSGS